MAYTLPALGYDYNALEPQIDAKTMEIHHSKHHNAYVTNLNNATKDTAMADLSLVELCKNMDMTNMPVRNNGGGHYNHSLFWEVINPTGKGILSGDLKDAILAAFGTREKFDEEFAKAATTRFGSGWAWLCAHKGGKVEICSTPNQDNPLMPGTGCGGTPILGIDVWEHAYYLNYQNRRPDYIKAFMEIINWNVVEKKYDEAK
ncbi:MAG: hypothetical protein RLZZ546_1618 [Bacteroidota bacterium]|jgi:Fe-Mn family superoxide dismutase